MMFYHVLSTSSLISPLLLPAASSSFHAAGLEGGWNRLQLRRATKAVAAVFHEVGKPFELQEVRCWMEQRGNFSAIVYNFLQFSTQDSVIDDRDLLGWAALEIGWK